MLNNLSELSDIYSPKTKILKHYSLSFIVNNSPKLWVMHLLSIYTFVVQLLQLLIFNGIIFRFINRGSTSLNNRNMFLFYKKIFVIL